MPEKNPWLVPVSIVLAGALLGITLYVVRISSIVPLPAGDITKLRPVSTVDHVLGNPTAPVTIITYSDIECTYCKTFQEAMEQIMSEYGPQGKVAWVYRHFPLKEEHPNAPLHAKAAECVAQQGGSNAFFRFIDALQQNEGRGSVTPRVYTSIISSLGLSNTDFQNCMETTRYEKRVAEDYDNGLALGVNGVPYSVILIQGHDPVPVSGSLPYTAVKKLLDIAIQKAATPSTP